MREDEPLWKQHEPHLTRITGIQLKRHHVEPNLYPPVSGNGLLSDSQGGPGSGPRDRDLTA